MRHDAEIEAADSRHRMDEVLLQDGGDALLLFEEPGVLESRRLGGQPLFVQLVGEHASGDDRRGPVCDDLEEPLLTGVGPAPLPPAHLHDADQLVVVKQRRPQQRSEAALEVTSLDQPAGTCILDEEAAAQLAYGAGKARTDRGGVRQRPVLRRDARGQLQAVTLHEEQRRAVGAHRQHHLAYDRMDELVQSGELQPGGRERLDGGELSVCLFDVAQQRLPNGLGLLERGNVGQGDDGADDAAVRAAQRICVQDQVERGAVGTFETRLEPTRPVGVRSASERERAPSVQSQRQGVVERLEAGIAAGQPGDRPAGADDHAVLVADDDRLAGLLEDGPGEPLGLEDLLGLLLVGEVGEHGHDHLIAAVLEGAQREIDGAGLAPAAQADLGARPVLAGRLRRGHRSARARPCARSPAD